MDEKKTFFGKLFSGLDKTRKQVLSGVESVLKNFRAIDDGLFEELEEALILADVGAQTAADLTERTKRLAKARKLTDASEVKAALRSVVEETLACESFVLPRPAVILVVGVNGVGKTTTIGKLAAKYKAEGRAVLLAAGDTFRAAAAEQLKVWGERGGVPVISHAGNADPGAVVFDAAKAAKARGADVLICDTAGRLHNKKNLMDELAKISRILTREWPEAARETLLVLDAATGQNALSQAAAFKQMTDVTGLVLTKLDGTAKGGVIIGLRGELGLPVRFVGVGEGIDDLQPFDPAAFAAALFGDS